MLIAFLCIVGVGITSIGMHHINDSVVRPRRAIVGNTSAKAIKEFRPQHASKYVFYRDFTSRRAWVSQRSHGHFNGSVCEAAAIETALRLEGLVKNVNLHHFTRKYIGYPNGNGRTSPYTSYDRNPYLHHGASVYSQPIARAAEKAGSKAKVIDGTKVSKIIGYLEHGHPVYVEAGHEMNPIWHGRISDHTLVLAGIRQDKRGRIQVKYMDPNCNTYRGKTTGWCSLRKFLLAWKRPYLTGERAVVLLGRDRRQNSHRHITKIIHRKVRTHDVIKSKIKSAVVSKK